MTLCTAELKIPDLSSGVRRTDLQEALDNVPVAVKQQNPSWGFWTLNGLEPTWRTWKNFIPPNAGGGGSGGGIGELAPGTKEPFYLFGPNEKGFDVYRSASLVGLGAGRAFKGSGSGGLFHSRKREVGV
ncbi:hypothetical protein TWF730_009143 [Orbilia blumenaviensis]|uniref:Uncharacterized protein n=1 Tax=Orbilia blumenaviensis TaxID=1796055 RepID=A0AAV9UYW6_9PEZI